MVEHSENIKQPFEIKMSIEYKILLSVLLVVFLAVFATTYIAVVTESRALHKNLIDKGRNIAKNIAFSTKSAFWSLNWIFVENLLHDAALIANGDIIYTKIVKPNGEVYLANDKKYYGTLVSPDLLKDKEQILDKYPFENQTGNLLIYPVKIGKENWHILLGLSTGRIRLAAKNLILQSSLWGIICLILSVVISLFLSDSISKPIVNLARAAQNISDGSQDHLIHISSQDETGLLCHSFNKMIKRIHAAQKALKASNDRFITVLDSMDATIFVADMETHKIIFMNRAMKDIFGKDHEGDYCHQVFKGSDRPCWLCRTSRLTNESGIPTGVTSWEDRNPVNNRWYMNYDRAIRWTDERVVHLRISFDITKTKELEQQRLEAEQKLRQSQKMEAIGKLAGGVAHDLNNILSGIINYPELLLMDLPDNHEMRGPIKEIQATGERAATIVDDLLTLARRGVSVGEVLNLNTIISRYLSLPECEKLLSFHPGVAFRLSLAEDLKSIKGSPVHLLKTVMNIVSNAAEAMPDGGIIRIETRNVHADQVNFNTDHESAREYILLSVSDQGIGIAPEEQEKIFEPFYTKKVMGRSGTGLGMAVVWGTVEDHCGHIDLQSETGKGTVFNIYFPVTTEEMVIMADETIDLSDYMGSGETILIVDDVKEQRIIGSKMLKWLGYNVETVSSGEDAVEYARHHSLDLIILDMIMAPGISGLMTYEQIIEFKPDQRAILASGYSKSDDVKKTLSLGAGTYLRKPYTIEQLAQAVKLELTRNL